ncbi:hypothetical protein RSAG8_13628, partial [Rhizoctonia solani AG-8 WAC10335]
RAQVTSLGHGPLISWRDELDVMDKCGAEAYGTDSNRRIITISCCTLHIPANVWDVFLELA